MTIRYLANRVSNRQIVSSDGRCTYSASPMRRRLPASAPRFATTGERKLMPGTGDALSAMQAARGIVATHVAVEHHAVRLRHQYAAALTLDHVFDHFLVRCWWSRGARSRLFTQALEQDPNQYGNDRQKNYFSHLSRPCVKSMERNNCYLSADGFCADTLILCCATFRRTRARSQNGRATPCALRDSRVLAATLWCP